MLAPFMLSKALKQMADITPDRLSKFVAISPVSFEAMAFLTIIACEFGSSMQAANSLRCLAQWVALREGVSQT